MALPDYETCMLPVLRIGAEGETSVRTAIDRLADEFKLTAEERDQPMPSGGTQTLFANRVQWAVTYLVHADVLKRPRRAHFEATDRGHELLERNPARINGATLREYPEFTAWISKTTKAPKQQKPSPQEPGKTLLEDGRVIEAGDHLTPYERIEEDVTSLELALQSDLIERLIASDPNFFEQVIVDLLVAMGYGGSRQEAGRRIGKSGDGGIDGVIDEDPLGLDVIYLQAKRYSPDNKVSSPEIRAFAGSLDGFGANKGVFVTTSSFTKDAVSFADRVSRRIILMDGEELARLMSRYGVGVRVAASYQIKRIDEDYFPAD